LDEGLGMTDGVGFPIQNENFCLSVIGVETKRTNSKRQSKPHGREPSPELQTGSWTSSVFLKPDQFK
jgi:hypothetical protein